MDCKGNKQCEQNVVEMASISPGSGRCAFRQLLVDCEGQIVHDVVNLRGGECELLLQKTLQSVLQSKRLSSLNKKNMTRLNITLLHRLGTNDTAKF